MKATPSKKKTSSRALSKAPNNPATTPKPSEGKPRAWVAKELGKPIAARIEDQVRSTAKQTLSAIRRALDKELVDGLDGYVSFEPKDKRFLSGDTGGIRAADDRLSWLLPKGLSALLSQGDFGKSVKLKLRPHGAVDSGKTDQHGIEPTSVEELNQLRPLGLDSKRGGVLSIQATAEGKTVTQKVLALPNDYDGPIFVSDIDDTLRPTSVAQVLKGQTQAPIEGAQALLQGVAERGIPIVYLSAGPQRLGSVNDAFLKQLPEGVLLARSRFDVQSLSPRNSDQAKSQGDYKAQRLAQLKATYPKARIFGLGDDKYGDAVAYSAVGARAYIHDVRAGNDNIPKGFDGVVTKSYDAPFQKQVFADLDAATASSRAFQ